MSTQTKITDEIFLRPVIADDREFLLDVYASSREMELSLVPWEKTVKRAFVEHQFDAQTSYYSSERPTAQHDVIELTTGERVGRIYVERSDEQIAILDITILPDFRHRGIGSAIISSLVEEARASDRSVQIYVETFNPSQKFFTNRGFTITETVGINFRFVWSPDQKS